MDIRTIQDDKHALAVEIQKAVDKFLKNHENANYALQIVYTSIPDYPKSEDGSISIGTVKNFSTLDVKIII